ncbi:MAG: Mov34/MPN/PAD-1 family protein [Candidatus Woesearchaeota archaeon]|jgi:hypothetical protein
MRGQIVEEPEEHPIWKVVKKTVLIIMGLFLLYLTISYIGFGSEIINIIHGQLASEKIQQTDNYYYFTLNTTTVIFSNALYEQILLLYETNQQHEFIACLYGTYENETYTLTELAVPEIYSQSVFRVVSAGCDKALVTLHSHPYKHCLFSDQDIISYNSFAAENDNGLYAMMCEENRFNWIGY